MDADDLLVTSKLTKWFGGVSALEDVDFRLGSRELVGLIGPNGAGKTTFFNVVTGMMRPTSGSEENRITPLEALRVFTAHAAWSVFEEKHKGTLERGKQADFVVLAEDPTQPGVAIKDIRIVRTVHRGQDVYLDGQTSNPMRGQG